MAMQKCPVCEGRQTMPESFYTRVQDGMRENLVKCRSCDGHGVVFSPEGKSQGGPIVLQTGTNPNPDGFRYFDDDADRWDWWNRRGQAWVTFNPPFDYIITNVEDA